MAKPREHEENLLEELQEQIIVGRRSPTPVTEAPTPPEQTRALFHSVDEETQSTVSRHHILSQENPELVVDSEQRQKNSTTVNIKQLEDKQTTVNMKTNREIIKRQRQLACQLMEEIERHWEETERESNATQEKLQLLKMQAEISQQRATLDRSSSKKDISQHRDQTERTKQKWTKIQRDTEMQRAAEVERRERQKKGADTFDNVKVKVRRILEEMKKLWDVLEDSKQQLEITLREKQELNTEIGQIENMKSDALKQQQDMKADVEKQKQQRHKQELDNKLQITNKKRKLEMFNTETEVKKMNLIKRRSRRKKQKTSKKKKETKQDMEERQDKTEGQRSVQVLEVNVDEHKTELQQVDRTRRIIQHKEHGFEEDNMEMSTTNKVKADMQKVIFEVQEIRKMLCMVKEEQRKSIFTEGKSQIKWRNFQENKKRWKLEQWQEKIIKERDELEIMKIKMQQQREEAEKELEATITAILTVGEMKAKVEKAATEINNTQEEMVKVQREMERNKEEVKTYMVLPPPEL
ncbi:trichohyalin-like isoform X2 [Seriola aureovittata]|uniref:trichohyalin-like isoform X2 n=1 Tax=Seriola aureovittata TaxID=2871759 RepID=UPI0024BECDE8|nr:trichohyalin-like isoform X2 [Seriola aureovittata]